ncbi:MAG TPA: hypothetical protein GX726_03355 [Clostridiales bacterium]|jgi:hypothetical protein|nr:hypothetical protein [Clostridiales bacterium]
MFGFRRSEEDFQKPWHNAEYLTTASDSLQADILESKLRGENIPVIRRYRGAGNALEIIMGSDMSYPIDLYVPAEYLEDARNVIIPIPLVDDMLPEE